MALTDLSSAQIERLVQLVKEKEILQAELARVNHSLDGLEKDEPPSHIEARLRVRGRRRRIGLKAAILKSLEAAGTEGMTVKELAEKTGGKPSSVYVWFYTTGKKIKGIKKVGKAKFAFVTA